MLNEHLSTLDVSLDAGRVERGLVEGVLLLCTQTSIQQDEHNLRVPCEGNIITLKSTHPP